MIKLYQIEYEIDGRIYGPLIPARSWDHAQEIASSFGAKVTGGNVSQLSCIPAHQLMSYVEAVAEVQWKYNAVEQLEAFLAMDWPQEAKEVE